ncbi:MAG: S41 family peptidase [Bacteroidota bacterium]
MRITLLFFAMLLFAPKPSVGLLPAPKTDSLPTILSEIFTKVKQYSLFRSTVNWDELQSKILNSNGAVTEVDFKNKVRLIFETIGDKHGAFYYKGERLGMDQSWTKKLRIPENWPENVILKTQMLEQGYGYILIPPSQKYDLKTCQRYQDSLCSLGLKNLKGLIIDLRLQEGGSVYPLFTGLNQVYGTTYFGSNRDSKGKEYLRWTKKYGGVQVNTNCQSNSGLKIVVLMSQITASAGEMMAVALKGRPKTLFIGEATAGLTTMNVSFNLGSYQLAIAASAIADRKGKIYNSSVLPDLTIVEGDNFKNLLVDTKVIAALKWMKE